MSCPIHSEAVGEPRLLDLDGHELALTFENVMQVFRDGGKIESQLREWHEPIGDET